MAALKNLMLVIGSSLLTLILFEMILRIFTIPPQIIEFEKGYDLGTKAISNSKEEINHDSYFWTSGVTRDTPTGIRYKPNVKLKLNHNYISGNTVSIETNSLGYRNPEIGEKKYKRVLFLGDSITAGDYLEEKDTFVRQVEELSQLSGERLETINTGIPGISLQTELAILIETGLSTKPDVVVLGFYLNDFAPSLGLKMLKVPRLLQSSYLAQNAVKAISLIKQLLSKEKESDIIRYSNFEEWFDELKKEYPSSKGDPLTNEKAFNRLINENNRDWGMAWSNKAWESQTPLFQELYRLSKIHKFELLFLIFPVREQVKAEFVYDYPQQKLKNLAKRYEIPVLDFLPILREDWQKNKIEIFYDQCHHNPRGKKIIAENILEFIRKN